MTALAVDVVVADSFDTALVAELVATVPGLGSMVAELNARCAVGGDLVRDLVLTLWQAAPRFRSVEEMSPRHRLAHVVITTMAGLPELATVRRFTVHDGFGAAMAALSLQARLEQLLEEGITQGLLPLVRHLLRAGLATAERDRQREVTAFAVWGTGRGRLVRLPYAERAALASRFADLAAFLDALGRLRVTLPGTGQRASGGREEVWDVDLSDRLPDVVASEYARLTSGSALRLDFYQQLAEGMLLTRRYRGPVEPDQGPLVVCVDVSASMQRPQPDGVTGEAWAKGFLLAMLQAAGQRPFVAILFADTDRHLIFRFTDGPPTVTDQVAMVSSFLGGGTDFASALAAALVEVEGLRDKHAGQADLVFVTDGECALTQAQLRAVRARTQSLGIMIHGIGVGDSPDPKRWAFADTITPLADYRRSDTSAAGGTLAEQRFPFPERSVGPPAQRFPNPDVPDSLFTESREVSWL